MPLTAEDVQNKRFSETRFAKGYDEDEVDAFLDEVEAELRRLTTENSDLRARLAAGPQPAGPPAAGPPPPAPPPPPVVTPPPAATADQTGQEAALRTLLLAQRTADEAVAQARAEAEQIIGQARAGAATVEREARDRSAAELAGLSRQRAELAAQVEGLRNFEREYRTRLRAYLESQLRDLETRVVEPSPPAGGPPGPFGAQPPAAPPATLPTTAPPAPAAAPPTPAPLPPARGPFTAPPQAGPPREAGPSTTDTTDIDERHEDPPLR
ncbi:MAG TPA: DivIVA domain-containing protein [Mycobacteriales bacterium]|nr:DivIVA domain-containing protein [Mycobacteriales bacterium]